MDNNVLLEMLIEQKELIKSVDKKISTQQNTSSQLDIEKVEQLSDQMQTSIIKIDEVVEQVRKPIVKQNKFTLDIVSKETLFLFIGMVVIISALSAGLYLANQPNYDRIDNDLKYRYIKMKGEATPKQIAELEDLFEFNRDNKRIEKMWEDVTQFEEVVHKKALLDEQNRLRAFEVEKLNNKAMELKQK